MVFLSQSMTVGMTAWREVRIASGNFKPGLTLDRSRE